MALPIRRVVEAGKHSGGLLWERRTESMLEWMGGRSKQHLRDATMDSDYLSSAFPVTTKHGCSSRKR